MKVKGKILKIGLTVIILIALVYKVGIKDIIVHLKDIKSEYIIPLLLIQSIIISLGATNIFVLAKKIKKDLRFATIFKQYTTVWGISLFTPGRLGDVGMSYFLSKDGVPLGKALAVVVIDDLITLASLGIIALYGIFSFFSDQVITIATGGLILLGAVIVFLLSERSRRFVRRVILKERSKHFKGFGKSLGYFRKEEKTAIATNAVITIVKLFCIYMIYYVSFLIIGVKTDYLDILRVIPLARLISLIPLTINGAGIKEAVAVYLFSLLGIQQSATLSALILITIVTYLAGAAAIVCTFFGPKEKHEHKHTST